MPIAHVIAMATANAVSPGFAANYGQIQAVYWSFAPVYAFLQLFVVVIVWMHGSIGLYSWLVLKPVWRRIGGLVLPVLFAVPILALLGFAQSGQEVLDKLANDAAWKAMILENVGKIAKVTRELAEFQSRAIWTYAAAAWPPPSPSLPCASCAIAPSRCRAPTTAARRRAAATACRSK
jgi:adenylate cyclase